MREVDLTAVGFPGYVLREDGTLQRPDGRVTLKPYASGQICMKNVHGVSVFRPLARLVAFYFVDNPENYMSLRFLDGDRSNCSALNIQWTFKRFKRTSKELERLRPDIIMSHTFGMSISHIAQQFGVTTTHVHDVIYRFNEEVMAAP
jgi:hypothetical protein